MHTALFTLFAMIPRALAWLSLVAVSAGLAYLTTAAIAPGDSTAVPATQTDSASLARTGLTGAQVVERLRPMLASRGMGVDVVNGPMIAHAPGQTGASAADQIAESVDSDMDAMVGPLQREAWLVFTTAGRWWLWEYGVAAPADRRALLAESDALRHASPEGRGVD